MQILISKRVMALFISVALIFTLGVTASLAQQKLKIAGKFTATYTKQETIEIGDTDGHTIDLSKSEGTNVSTGENKIADSALVVIMQFSDIVKGNGPHQGYVKFAENGDTSFAKYEGKVTTTLSDEGAPISTFNGTFFYIKGTGQLENIQGSGTYKGWPISQTEYNVEWEGEYFIKK